MRERLRASLRSGDGQVDYKEFVDVLARDTVALAAMGKRDMQSKQAMGVDAYAAMDEQLGHAKVKKAVGSINDPVGSERGRGGQPPASRASAHRDTADGGAGAGSKARPSADVNMVIKQASDALNSRFSDMHKAFQYIDLDRSGTLNEDEIYRALDLWNMPIDRASVRRMMKACDSDGDGKVNYDEFVDVLARDTVALAAMGKRGMQSKQAMGVDAYAAMDEQLGHAKVKKAVGSINDPVGC